MRVGKSTWLRWGSLKYWNGRQHSCWSTVGGWPDWMIICGDTNMQSVNNDDDGGGGGGGGGGDDDDNEMN